MRGQINSEVQHRCSRAFSYSFFRSSSVWLNSIVIFKLACRQDIDRSLSLFPFCNVWRVSVCCTNEWMVAIYLLMCKYMHSNRLNSTEWVERKTQIHSELGIVRSIIINKLKKKIRKYLTCVASIHLNGFVRAGQTVYKIEILFHTFKYEKRS